MDENDNIMDKHRRGKPESANSEHIAAVMDLLKEDKKGQYAKDLQVPFNTEREADIACGTLSVDPEPKRGGCKKTLTVKATVLHVHFEALEARSLRVGMNSFLDHLNLVVNTIEQFGPPRPVDSS